MRSFHFLVITLVVIIVASCLFGSRGPVADEMAMFPVHMMNDAMHFGFEGYEDADLGDAVDSETAPAVESECKEDNDNYNDDDEAENIEGFHPLIGIKADVTASAGVGASVDGLTGHVTLGADVLPAYSGAEFSGF